MSVVVAVIVVLACVVSGLFLQAVQKTNETYQALSDETEIYIECELAASSMKEASNYLTAQLRQTAGELRSLGLTDSEILALMREGNDHD